MKPLLLLCFISLTLSLKAPPNGNLGIDVSAWQGYINWGAVAADGITFAILRTTCLGGEMDSHSKTITVDA